MPDSTTPREARLLEYVAGCPSNKTHHVVIDECGWCGFLDWSSSTQADKPSYAVQRMTSQCARCASVYTRNPEVFAWVLAVIGKQVFEGNHHG